VLERGPEQVIEDLRRGIITDEVARNVYRVAYDPELLIVDQEETERMRAQERAARLKRGRAWNEFHAGWNRLAPSERALAYYGTWPDARPNRQVIRI
jgi:acetophenone carboxylase